jgi:surfeit locus 1 family protein
VGLKNLAYAMQWWVFGIFAGFMWWRMCTETIAARRTKVA